MSKQAIDLVAPKFEGYKVVGLSEDKMRVALIDNKGVAYAYTFNAEDNGEVIASRIVPATLSVAFAFDGEDADVAVDMADIVSHVSVNAAATAIAECEELKTLRSDLDKANETIKTMQDAEHARRLQAVKDALKRTLAEIGNASEGNCDMAAECETLESNAEQYASMEDGDVAACNALKAMWAQKLISRKGSTQYVWTMGGEPAKGSNGPADIVGYFSK